MANVAYISGIKFNRSALNKKFQKVLDRNIFKEMALKVISPIFKRAKNTMLKDFNEHPITQEIEQGVGAENISGTLSGGFGDLFSFLGFDDGDKPIEPLRTLLEFQTELRPTVTRQNGNILYFRVNFPSKEQIDSVSDLPWENGNSWVEAVERTGLTNFSYYMSKKGYGRSSGGIQLHHEIQPGLSFSTTPYLQEILDEFRENIEENLL